jgi:hypothetical protein
MLKLLCLEALIEDPERNKSCGRSRKYEMIILKWMPMQ